jgi:hypothetical protein
MLGKPGRAARGHGPRDARTIGPVSLTRRTGRCRRRTCGSHLRPGRSRPPRTAAAQLKLSLVTRQDDSWLRSPAAAAARRGGRTETVRLPDRRLGYRALLRAGRAQDVYTIAARSTRPACAGQAAAALRIAWGPGSERRGGPQLHPRPRVRPDHPHQMCFRTPGKSRRRRTVGRLKPQKKGQRGRVAAGLGQCDRLVRHDRAPDPIARSKEPN